MNMKSKLDIAEVFKGTVTCSYILATNLLHCKLFPNMKVGWLGVYVIRNLLQTKFENVILCVSQVGTT